GGTLIIRMLDFINIDPYRYEQYSCHTSSLYFEKLVMGDWGLDPDVWNFPQASGYMPMKYEKGQLAESWELPDLLTCILHLRKGVYWHDKPPVNGREFVADDVVWNINRYNESPFVDKLFLKRIKSVTALDKYTVEIKLEPPETLGVWVNILDATSLLFVAPESVGESGEIEDKKNIIGTGAFIFEDYVPKSSISLKKNPNYWGYDERYPENKLPYVDAVKVLIISDKSTLLSALRTGKIDWMDLIKWKDAVTLQQTSPQLLSRKELLNNPNVFKPRWDLEPFNDLRVRQALSMALDREKIAETFYGGWADPKVSPLTAMHGEAYTPYNELPDKPMWTELSVKEVVSYNPKRAKELLAEAGYPNGFKTHLDTTMRRDDGMGEILQVYLADIGVDAELKVHEWGAFNTLRYGKKHTDMILHWISAYSDRTKWMSQAADPTHRFNLACTNDPVFNEKFEKMITALDEDEQTKLLRELDMYSMENVFYISLPHPQVGTFWQKWLKGYSGEGPLGSHNDGARWARVWIDKGSK
ncbi:ABC transporter substrate-binding protein, partial [Chloroflexota bacterium]